MSNSDRVQAWRKRAKQKLVEIAGGKCQLCGYDKCQAALEFHHLDPAEKDFAVTGSRVTRRFELMVAEVLKCVLVCANCHREIHQGLIDQEILSDSVSFDEELAQFYLVDVIEAKHATRFQKKIQLESEQVRKKIQQYEKLLELEAKRRFLSKWKDENPHTDHRIKKVDWSQHDVFKLLEEHKSYEAVGRLLGVTGAAIKRRVRHLESKQ